MRARLVERAAEFLAATEACAPRTPCAPTCWGRWPPDVAQGRRYEREPWCVVEDDAGTVVGAALRTAPYKLLLGPDAARGAPTRWPTTWWPSATSRPAWSARRRGPAGRRARRLGDVRRDAGAHPRAATTFVPPVGIARFGPPARRSTTSTSGPPGSSSSPSTPARSCRTPRVVPRPAAGQPVLGGRRRAGVLRRPRPAGRRRRHDRRPRRVRSTRPPSTAAAATAPRSPRGRRRSTCCRGRHRHAVHRRGQPDEQRRLRAARVPRGRRGRRPRRRGEVLSTSPDRPRAPVTGG